MIINSTLLLATLAAGPAPGQLESKFGGVDAGYNASITAGVVMAGEVAAPSVTARVWAGKLISLDVGMVMISPRAGVGLHACPGELRRHCLAASPALMYCINPSSDGSAADELVPLLDLGYEYMRWGGFALRSGVTLAPGGAGLNLEAGWAF